MVPAAVFMSLTMESSTARNEAANQATVMKISHGVAIILLVVYAAYLWFQLRSHSSLFTDTSENVARSVKYSKKASMESKSSVIEGSPSTSLAGTDSASSSRSDIESARALVPAVQNEEEEEKPQINKLAALILLVVTTVVRPRLLLPFSLHS